MEELLIPVVAIVCVIGIPMTGLVVRYALRPLVADVTRAIQGSAEEELDEFRERLARIENRLDAQDEEMARLAEAVDFYEQLEGGRE